MKTLLAVLLLAVACQARPDAAAGQVNIAETVQQLNHTIVNAASEIREALGLPTQDEALNLLTEQANAFKNKIAEVTSSLKQEVDLTTAMSKGRRQYMSMHQNVEHLVADDDTIDDEWYPENIAPLGESPCYILRTDCALLSEEERLHSLTHGRMMYEDREIEPQLVPHLPRDSTGFRSWRERERSWSIAPSARFDYTSDLHSSIGDSGYRDGMAQEHHSVQGASPVWLENVDSNGHPILPENTCYHTFYRDLETSAHAIPHKWYHSIPHELGPVSQSGKLLEGSSPSDVIGRTDLNQMWNARKQWKTLGCICGDFGKHLESHDSSDEQVFEQEGDHKSWEETLEEDPAFTEWTYGKPSPFLAWKDKNRYLQEGYSYGHKHGLRYHGAGAAIDIGFKNMAEELAEVPWKTEAAPNRENWDSQRSGLAVVTVADLHGKQKPEYNQHSTGWDDVPHNTQAHKFLVHSEEAAKVPWKVGAVPKREKWASEPSGLHFVQVEELLGKHKSEYDRHSTEWDDVPVNTRAHKFLVHSEQPAQVPWKVGAVPKREKWASEPSGLGVIPVEELHGKHKPEYDQQSTEWDDIPDNIQASKFLAHTEELPEVSWKTETAPSREKGDSEPIGLAVVPVEELLGKHKPEYDRHSTEWDDVPDNTQASKFLAHTEELPEVSWKTETAPSREKGDSEPIGLAIVPVEELHGKRKPEYDQHNTERDDVPDDIQDQKFPVYSESIPVELYELSQNTETVSDGEKLDSGPSDSVGEWQCVKETDEFGRYVIRCNEGFGDVKDQADAVQSDNLAAERDHTKEEVEEGEDSEPLVLTSVGDDEPVGKKNSVYDVLEPIKCSKNLAESGSSSSEMTEKPPSSEFSSEESKLYSELAGHSISPVEEFYKQKTVSEEHVTEWDDDPATLKTRKDVIQSDNFVAKVSELPWSTKALSGTETWEAQLQDWTGVRGAVSYDKQHGVFGHRIREVKDSSDATKIYADSLHVDNLPDETDEVSWQVKADPEEEKWNSEPLDQVSIYADESYGNRKWEQYVQAWKDVLDALKPRKDMGLSENYAGQIVKGPWRTEQMAQEEKWESDPSEQVNVRVCNSYYKPNPEWAYYSNSGEGEYGTLASVQRILYPGFAAKGTETTWRSEEISEEETSDNEPQEQHTILYDTIKTKGHPVHEDDSDAKALYLEWGSGEESEYESLAGVKVQSGEAHENQKVTPEHYSTEWMNPFDTIKNQNPIESLTFSAEAADVPWSHKVVLENEKKHYGTFAEAGGDADKPFRIQRPLEWYKPVTWKSVADGGTYEVQGAGKPQWDEHVQRGVLVGDEAVDRALEHGLPTTRIIYDAGASARGEWNFGTHQLPQNEYDIQQSTHSEGAIKSESRTGLWRSKADSSRTANKWRGDVEGIALPFEWPTKKNFGWTKVHPDAESKQYTGINLHGVDESTGEAAEHSWTVDNGRWTPEEWSDASPSSEREFSGEQSDSPEWSSSAEEGSGDWSVSADPVPNMIQRVIRFFATPIKKVACYLRENLRNGKAAKSRSRGGDAGFEPGTVVTPAPPPRLRPCRIRRPKQAKKKARGKLRGFAGALLDSACGCRSRRGHTTVRITMPED